MNFIYNNILYNILNFSEKKIRFTEKWRVREKDHLSTDILLQWPQWLELNFYQAMIEKFSGLSTWVLPPTSWCYPSLLAASRELDGQWNNLDLNQHNYGILIFTMWGFSHWTITLCPLLIYLNHIQPIIHRKICRENAEVVPLHLGPMLSIREFHLCLYLPFSSLDRLRLLLAIPLPGSQFTKVRAACCLFFLCFSGCPSNLCGSSYFSDIQGTSPSSPYNSIPPGLFYYWIGPNLSILHTIPALHVRASSSAFQGKPFYFYFF